ncbi:hypothetical protein shn_13775 [Shinella sp. HZN7]|nr:hypothetical protein shn_13775 [Shinella sp. HZN7]
MSLARTCAHKRTDDFFAKAPSECDPLGLGSGTCNDQATVKAAVQAQVCDEDEPTCRKQIDNFDRRTVQIIEQDAVRDRAGRVDTDGCETITHGRLRPFLWWAPHRNRGRVGGELPSRCLCRSGIR